VFVSVYVNQHATAFEEKVARSVTFPEKPLMLVTVTVVCLSELSGIEIEVALSVIVKSGVELVTVRDTVVVWDIDPLVPVMVIV
jgi:hypothetical protein